MSWLNLLPTAALIFALWRLSRAHERAELLTRAWDTVLPGSREELTVLLRLLTTHEHHADRRFEAGRRDDPQGAREADEMCALVDCDIQQSRGRILALVPIPIRDSRSA